MPPPVDKSTSPAGGADRDWRTDKTGGEVSSNSPAHPAVTTGTGHSGPPGSSTESHIRGSSLLLAGRLLALGLNLLTQIVAVRFFAKSDYGALAYGLSVATLGSAISLAGLDKAASRFIPMYREHGEQAKIFGSLVLMAAMLSLLGLAVVAAVLGFRALFAASLAHDPLAASLLLVLVLLAPVGAFDTLLVSWFAIFSGARAIVLRKHVLTPLLKLGATLAVVTTGGDVRRLAWGLVIAGVVGTGVYGAVLLRLLQRQGILQHRSGWRRSVPARELLSFALPLFGSDMVFFLRGTLVVLLLQHFKDATTVASYQAVVPAARLGIVVRDNFAYLFLPMAARLLVRGDHRGVEDLYRRTTIWVAMLSFPVFAVTLAFATPITILIFGERYASSGSVLAVLAFGQFLNATAGLSVLTLRALGKIKTLVAIDVVITALSLSLNLLLIPRHGAVGAAIATAATMSVHSVLNVLGLWRANRITMMRRADWRFYAGIALVTSLLVGVQSMLHPPLFVGLLLAALLIAAVGIANRHLLDVTGTFPELRRFWPLRLLLGRRDLTRRR